MQPSAGRRGRRAVPAALVAVLLTLVTACSSTSSSPDPNDPAPSPSSSTSSTTATGSTLDTIPPGAATVDNAETDLGTVLVDGRGFVLYVFTPDGTGPPTCVDSCAAVWPPVTGTTIAVAGNIMTNPGEFKLVPRPDGTLQLTANGHPLYRYSGDTSQGQTSGQGVGGQWFAAGPDGSPITG